MRGGAYTDDHDTTVNLLSIFKSPMILLGLVSMAAVFGMPYLMDNSKFSSANGLLAIGFDLVLTKACYSGPRVEEGVGRKPEEQPDEQFDGRPARGAEPHEQLRHGGVLGRILIEEQRGFGRRTKRKEPEGCKEMICLKPRAISYFAFAFHRSGLGSKLIRIDHSRTACILLCGFAYIDPYV